MTDDDRPPFFDECFHGMTGTHEFERYMEIVGGKSSATPARGFPEKHHIVPREWLSRRVDGFCADMEDARNVIYLGVRSKLVAMQCLALMFLGAGDSVAYREITKTISRRYHLAWGEVWKSPYLDRDTIDCLVERRTAELKNRKVRYDDRYLLECREIMASTADAEVAFEKVKDRLGFKFSRAALEEQLRRRFGRGWRG